LGGAAARHGPARQRPLTSGRARLALGLALWACSAPLDAQTVVELRGATTEYRFVDLNHTFKKGVLLDLLYLGSETSNELYAGAGWSWKPAPGVTLTPIVYGVAGKEADELGIALCGSIFIDRGGWRVLGFGGQFLRTSGDVPDYTFLDSLDVTRVFAGKWELGVSAGFLHFGGESSWNELLGGTLKFNDKRGATAIAVRGGYTTELRLIRTLVF
jgi:hypothetical protein